tara:strand:- start:256 stop:390 length:135 start_codon:yes stop_codon:yes gene_type:complete
MFALEKISIKNKALTIGNKKIVFTISLIILNFIRSVKINKGRAE